LISPETTIRQISFDDVDTMRSLLKVFGECFHEIDTYTAVPPSTAYLQQLLATDYFIVLVASEAGAVVGGLAAYELRKFEQQRSEIYIYDLAVAESHRRRGIARALIQELKSMAAIRGAYVIFVQADVGDEPAIALYSELGTRENVLHFDIPVQPGGTR
jgi:aminoglycoside 3-N-acetyltransferase I